MAHSLISKRIDVGVSSVTLGGGGGDQGARYGDVLSTDNKVEMRAVAEGR